VVALGACGGAGRAPPPGADAWAGNAAILVGQLRRDLLLATSGGSTPAAARRALGSPSRLYTILIAYTDFGGCGTMLRNVGAPARGLGRVGVTLAAACRILEHAAALFTRAVTRRDPDALVAAGRSAQQAEPLLERAQAELAVLRAR
jgi:hypothetical protein